MALTNEDLKAIADLMDQKLEPINQRLDKVESKLDTMHVWQQKNFERLEELKSEKAVKENGKLRLEGKDYVMQDGDICYFRFNV